MALIKCNNCGKPVSDKVVACPHCGKSPFPQKQPYYMVGKKSHILTISTIILILMHLFYCVLLFNPQIYSNLGVYTNLGAYEYIEDPMFLHEYELCGDFFYHGLFSSQIYPLYPQIAFIIVTFISFFCNLGIIYALNHKQNDSDKKHTTIQILFCVLWFLIIVYTLLPRHGFDDDPFYFIYYFIMIPIPFVMRLLFVTKWRGIIKLGLCILLFGDFLLLLLGLFSFLLGFASYGEHYMWAIQQPIMGTLLTILYTSGFTLLALHPREPDAVFIRWKNQK